MGSARTQVDAVLLFIETLENPSQGVAPMSLCMWTMKTFTNVADNAHIPIHKHRNEREREREGGVREIKR